MPTPPVQVEWRECAFSELSVFDLYDLLCLRAAVFVVEQERIHADLDNRDYQARHLLGVVDGIVLAYARIFAPEQSAAGAASIDRLVTAQACRRRGLGRLVLREAISVIERRWGKTPIHIDAPPHLAAFFESAGFSRDCEHAVDGLHLRMIRRGRNPNAP